MNTQDLTTWFTSKQSRPYAALQEHTSIFHSLFTCSTTPSQAAEQLNTHITSSKQISDTAYRFHQLLFAAAAELPLYHDRLISLVKAIQLLPPRPEKANALDAGLWSAWSDFRSYLQTRRIFTAENPRDDFRSSIPELSSAARAVNFTGFSAKLLASGAAKVSALGIYAFLDLRDGLEYGDAAFEAKVSGREGVVTGKQFKAIDVPIAAQWVLYGGEKVLGLGNGDFGERWEKALEVETDAWKGEAGVSKGRWEVWEKGFMEVAERIGGDGAEIGEWARKEAEGALEVIEAAKR